MGNLKCPMMETTTAVDENHPTLTRRLAINQLKINEAVGKDDIAHKFRIYWKCFRHLSYTCLVPPFGIFSEMCEAIGLVINLNVMDLINFFRQFSFYNLGQLFDNAFENFFDNVIKIYPIIPLGIPTTFFWGIDLTISSVVSMRFISQFCCELLRKYI